LNESAEAVIRGVDAENAGPRWQDPLIGSSKSKGSFVAPHVAFEPHICGAATLVGSQRICRFCK
jgi:hypothetical protein